MHTFQIFIIILYSRRLIHFFFYRFLWLYDFIFKMKFEYDSSSSRTSSLDPIVRKKVCNYNLKIVFY